MIRSEQEYKEAVERLKRWAHAYYVLDEPEVPDATYDQLYREVLEWERAHPELVDPTSPTQRVGAPPARSFKKVRHLSKMWSMEDLFDSQELRDWLNRLYRLAGREDIPFSIEPKFDGASLNLIYEGGILRTAATRGDGEVGEDVTSNARTIPSIPLTIDYLGTIEIRGEVVIPIEAFRQLNQERLERGESPFANPRNAAAGSLRQLDASVSARRRLQFYPWGVGYNELEFDSLYELMEWVYRLGFKRPFKRALVRGYGQIEELYQEFKRDRAQLPVMLDGMVIKVDEIPLHEKLGYTLKYPRWMAAYKFPPVEEMTRLIEVIPQVGRTGVITPVARVEPVLIGGVEVERVSLHNYKEIERKDIRLGDMVLVIRAGDVIPEITKALPHYRTGQERPIQPPSHCPVCREPLLEEGTLLKCQNLSCPARVVASVVHFASKGGLDIAGLGPETVALLYQQGLVRDLVDLFQLDYKKLRKLPGFQEKRARNLVEAIQRAKGVPCWRFINALGIEHIGEVASKKICHHLGVKWYEADPKELLKIKGFGPEMVHSLETFLKSNREKVALLSKLVEPRELESSQESTPLAGKVVALTGTMPLPRSKLRELLEQAGARVVSAISKRVDLLFAGERPGSKYERAKELGIPIRSAQELLKLLGVGE
ncbi:MAG: DNA ligase (NAD(+)) LigA [Nitratiruptor sp.]|nr:DNA ligase (NAD(+)) LigA [Nitratiruptor sp.]NPA83929.1 NAD-dependent DNA ligase LigA [Campylobacterota bacterium]